MERKEFEEVLSSLIEANSLTKEDADAVFDTANEIYDRIEKNKAELAIALALEQMAWLCYEDEDNNSSFSDKYDFYSNISDDVIASLK